MNAPTAKGSALHTMGRRRRRALVLVMQLGMAAYALTFVLGGAESWVVLVLILALQALYTVVFFRIVRPIQGELMKGDVSKLDERQATVRDRAHYHAYQILAAAVVTVVAAPMVAALYGGGSYPFAMGQWQFVGLFFFFTNLGISLPASVVAWTEPDPSPDQED